MSEATTYSDAPEAGVPASTMGQSSPDHYQDVPDLDFVPRPGRRADRWKSADSMAFGSNADEPLVHALHERDESISLDLDFGEGALARPNKRRRRWMVFAASCAATFIISLVAVDILLRVSVSTWPEGDVDEMEDAEFRGWGKAGSGTEGMAWYPTNFLQDVTPKPIHSHNDYWRKVPLFTAIKQGCIGVEADVWLFDDPKRNDTLYVGHEKAALQPNRTFTSLYIQPLVDILERQNPATDFYNDSYRGVFDAAPNQTLILLVDLKTAGDKTWAKVVEQLEPLRQRNWLSFFANGTVHTRPITVVGTGNTPFDQVVANSTYRDYFFDAPLGKLTTAAAATAAAPYDATNSYYTSMSFDSAVGSSWMGRLSKAQMDTIRRQVAAAHERGLKVRYWDLPSWPVSLRNQVWDVLVKEGVDILNVDDVKSAAKRQWT